LTHPPEDEERRPDAVLLEDLEQAHRVRLDAALYRVPACTRHEPVEDTDVEVVLDVDRHRVDDGGVRGVARHNQAPLRRITVLIVSNMMYRSRAIDRFLM